MNYWVPESVWNEHSGFPVEVWKHEVANDETRLGYVEWVNNQIESMGPDYAGESEET